MSYKTILVHVDESSRSDLRVKIAAQIAMANNAHLIGTTLTGISRYIYQGITVGMGDSNFAVNMNYLRDRADEVLEKFRQSVKQVGVDSFETEISNDEATGGIGLKARYSDLVVIGQTNPDEPSPSVMSDFPESVVVNSGRPVLIIPFAGEVTPTPKRVVVAWDGGREASRALTDAIPFLKKADIVHVAVFNPDSFPHAHGDVPGADIALYLARHGVKVEVFSQKAAKDVGSSLLAFARDVHSDMVVLGGYGHSRFREMILGGVTRTVLQNTTIPLLMSH